MSNLPPPPPPGPPPPPPAPVVGAYGVGSPGPVVGMPQGRAMATASLVCGIAGLVVFPLFVVGAVALVLGLVAASQIKRGPLPHDGLGRARAGWILGTIATALFALFVVALIAGGLDDDERHVNDLEVGDCVDIDVDTDVTDDVDDAEVDQLPVHECTEPHTGEVYLVGELADADEYPGVDAVTDDIDAQCYDALGDYAARAVLVDEPIVYVLIYPQEENWRFDDRHFTCIAVRADGAERTGSIGDDD